MIPIQELLHRIQWDSEFGKAEFVIGYLDRVSGTVARVPFRRIRFPSGGHFALEVVEDDGAVHDVPLHRMREVWRDGVLIWHREPQSSTLKK
jgi:uncharacterized protein (UPF0248 family)